MELPGRRRQVRPQRKFMVLLIENMQKAGVTEEGARDRMR